MREALRSSTSFEKNATYRTMNEPIPSPRPRSKMRSLAEKLGHRGVDKEKSSPIKTVILRFGDRSCDELFSDLLQGAGDCGSTRVCVGRAQVEKFPGTTGCVALMRVKWAFRFAIVINIQVLL